MQWGRSEQEKQDRNAEKERAAAAKRADKDNQEAELRSKLVQAQADFERKNRMSTPLGQAEVAMEDGDRFFQLTIVVSELDGAPSSLGSSENRIESNSVAPALLGEIEALGWQLEHVGYVFIETGATSTNRVLSTGQGTVTRGQVRGMYLFRNTRIAG